MINISEARKQTYNLCRDKKYNEAAQIFQMIWDDKDVKKNMFDYQQYALCLKYLKNWQRCLDIAYEGINKFSDSEILRNLYGWSIYYLKIKDCQEQKELELAVNEIMKYIKKDDQFSPYVLSIFKIIEFYKYQNQVRYDKILYWCEKLNPEKLDDDPFKLEGGKELPSKKEKYFMYLSYALFGLKRYEDCVRACDKALEIKNLHYNNQIWFKRRKALCFFHIGNYDEALKLMLEIKNQISEWFIFLELSEIYYANGDHLKGYKYLLKAALSKGGLEKKIHIYKKLWERLSGMHMEEEAKKHFILFNKIRFNNGWKLFSNIEEKELMAINEKSLIKELRYFWEFEYAKFTMKIKGTVISIFPDGKSGFIKSSDGNKYYFKTKGINHARVNDKLEFIVDESFDPKKKKISEIAVLC